MGGVGLAGGRVTVPRWGSRHTWRHGVGLGLGLCRFPAHDVGMAARKVAHCGVGSAPVLRPKLLRLQGPGGDALVGKRRRGRSRVGSARKSRQRRVLCQRQGWRQQGQAGQPAGQIKRKRGAHGDLQTTNKALRCGLPGAKRAPSKGCKRTSGVGGQAMGGLMARAAAALANGAMATGRTSTAPGCGEVFRRRGNSTAEWQISQAEHSRPWVCAEPSQGLAEGSEHGAWLSSPPFCACMTCSAVTTTPTVSTVALPTEACDV